MSFFIDVMNTVRDSKSYIHRTFFVIMVQLLLLFVRFFYIYVVNLVIYAVLFKRMQYIIKHEQPFYAVLSAVYLKIYLYKL